MKPLSQRLLAFLLLASPSVAQDTLTLNVEAKYDRAEYSIQPGNPQIVRKPMRKVGITLEVKMKPNFPPVTNDWIEGYTGNDGKAGPFVFENASGIEEIVVTCISKNGDQGIEVVSTDDATSHYLEYMSMGDIPSPKIKDYEEVVVVEPDGSSDVDVSVIASHGSENSIAFSIFDFLLIAKDWAGQTVLGEFPDLECVWQLDPVGPNDHVLGMMKPLWGEKWGCADRVYAWAVQKAIRDKYGINGPIYGAQDYGVDEEEFGEQVWRSPLHAFALGFKYAIAGRIKGSNVLVYALHATDERWVFDMEHGVIEHTGHVLLAQPRTYAYNRCSPEAVAMALWDMLDANDDDNDTIQTHVLKHWQVLQVLKNTPVDMRWYGLELLNQASGPQKAALTNILHSRLMEGPEYENAVEVFKEADVAIPNGGAGGVSASLALPQRTVNNPTYPTGDRHASMAVSAFLSTSGSNPRKFDMELLHDGDNAVLMTGGEGAPGSWPETFSMLLYSRSRVNFGHLYPSIWLYAPPNLLEDAPWLPPKDNLGAFSGNDASQPWTFRIIDSNNKGKQARLEWIGIQLTPSDYGDIGGFGGMAWVDNTLYEWLGDGASHEASQTDSFDSDGKMNIDPMFPDPQGNDDDDGVVLKFIKAEHKLEVTALVKIQGAKEVRYRRTNGTAIPLRVTAWLDLGIAEGPVLEIELEPVPDGIIVGDPRSPVNWGPGLNEMEYKGDFLTPIGFVAGTEVPVRVRLSYDVETPLSSGAESFGEVEDHAAEIDDD